MNEILLLVEGQGRVSLNKPTLELFRGGPHLAKDLGIEASAVVVGDESSPL